MNAQKVELGRIVATAGVVDWVGDNAGRQGFVFRSISRHQAHDWGDLCDEDRQLNDLAAEEGSRLLSAYTDDEGTKIWIITEWDRSATTVLFPEEY